MVSNHPTQCKIAIIGNVDAGKSSLVGVLSKGENDDGRGSAREKIFNFPHEMQTGRTSSISQEIMGFKSDLSQYIPSRYNQIKNKYWKEVVENSSKIVTLLDLCGHEKYLKTTMFGLTGLAPDYSMIAVGLNMGLQKMTKEHLGISMLLEIPFFIVLTKEDICPENIKLETTQKVCKMVTSPQVGRLVVKIKQGHDKSDIQRTAENLDQNRVCPVFTVSSVTGEGIEELRYFLSVLPNRNEKNKVLKTQDDPFEFDIHEHFYVKGIGIVVSGLVRSGKIGLNQSASLGPDKNNNFKQVQIKSIHLNRTQAEMAVTGEFACFQIKSTDTKVPLVRKDLRKGMVMLDSSQEHKGAVEFEANVSVLHLAGSIQENYQAVLHCGVIRQSCAVKKIYLQEKMLNGEKGLVRFKFLFSPEYLQKDEKVLFREGSTKLFGHITRIFTEEDILLEQQLIQTENNIKNLEINNKNKK